MSCHLTDTEDIALIVDYATAGARYFYLHYFVTQITQIDTKAQVAEKLARLLAKQNADSVVARYPDTAENFENAPGPVPGWKSPEAYADEAAGHGTGNGSPIYSTEALKAIHGALASYEYQSCETREWLTSEAHAVVVRIKDQILADIMERV